VRSTCTNTDSMFSFSHDEVEYKMPKFSAAEFFSFTGNLRNIRAISNNCLVLDIIWTNARLKETRDIIPNLRHTVL
jgi:hypothetical protein